MKRVNCLNAARGPAVWAASLLLAFGLNSAVARPPHKPPPKYTVIDLGTVPGLANSMVGYGRPLNNRGQVVGASYNIHFTDDLPFVWQKGVMTLLPTPPGANTIAGGQAINERGQIVGTVAVGYDYTAAAVVGDAWVVLPSAEEYDFSNALGINNRGTICGVVQKVYPTTPWTPDIPVIWRHGRMQALEPLKLGEWEKYGSMGDAMAINDRDQVVGYSGDWYGFDDQGNINYYGIWHATLWDRGEVFDLGTLGGPVSQAYAINNRGQTVGWSWTPDMVMTAVLWPQPGETVALPSFPGKAHSTAISINTGGDIVGGCADAWIFQTGTLVLTPGARAVLWKDGAVYDLNAFMPAGSDYVLILAEAINDRGQIVVTGWNGSQQHLFLLQPQPFPASTASEE